jgi:hypothetical protein
VFDRESQWFCTNNWLGDDEIEIWATFAFVGARKHGHFLIWIDKTHTRHVLQQ